ncbi:MAG: CPBP family intramembrane glutamic endopeptidase [Candidatus Lokiarchaeia archaeon]|nr:CPBP family intramembrane glutamic endopeptidase [Candidatus Lokiarchaeia archaeon]
MTVQLGENSWILIGLTFFELLFVILPALFLSNLKKKSFMTEINDMGFQMNDRLSRKIISGLCFGIIFFFLSGYLILFFRDFIIRNLLGSEFVESAQEGAITTTPIQPNIIQMSILIILQIIITGPCEEAFFRGFLIKKFNLKLKSIYSILISSTIFSLYHVPPFLVPLSTTITFFGYYFTFGLLLSSIYIYFNYSIIPNSIAHSLFNILVMII